jgi:hypothetical protein
MRLVSRLAPPAAIATLAAAALAISPALASADQQECRAGMLANSQFFQKRMNDYAVADNWAMFWHMVEANAWSLTAYSKC